MSQTGQEQIEAIGAEAINAAVEAEERYQMAEAEKRLAHGQPSRFPILEHPYADILSNAGRVLVAAYLWAENVRPSKAKEYARLIMEPGGIIRYDRQNEPSCIESLTRLVPEAGEISDVVWEERALGHVDQIVSCVLLAKRLPEHDPSLRFTSQELFDISSYAQVCFLAKTKGIDALKLYRNELIS